MHVNAFLFLLAWRMSVTVGALLLPLASRMLARAFLLLLAWRMLVSA
ncbi:hypothetical protein A2U01_0105946, partial [Trifolium medium]|nr:hypothetical protein [Trifolium medium]